MPETVKASVHRQLKTAALGTGVFAALTRLGSWPGVAVLCYHAVRDTLVAPRALPFAGLHVPAAHFAAHMALLRRLCHPVSLDQLVAHLTQGRSLPRRAVHVTFDDGYRSVWTRAVPVLETYDVPASVFVCTQPVATGSHFWYDAMAQAEGDAAAVAVRDGGGADWPTVLEAWSPPVPRDHELTPLSPDEVRRLAVHPLMAVGSHTRTHPVLAQLDAAGQAREVAAAIDTLEEWTGVRPRAFAYPVGRPGHDYDARTHDVLRDAGVSLAFTTEPAWASVRRPVLEQPRFLMVDGWDEAELAYRLAWLWRT